MDCFINGVYVTEKNFWHKVNALATDQQKQLLLEGYKVRIAESIYHIENLREKRVVAVS